LLTKIKTLDDDYVKVDKIISTDRYVSENAKKVNRINDILNEKEKTELGKDNYWNIKAITNEFNRIKEAYDAAKDKHRNYLSEYADA